MDLLEIRLLGSFQISRGNVPLAGFESNKVRALLAYLLAELGCKRVRVYRLVLAWVLQLAQRASRR